MRFAPLLFALLYAPVLGADYTLPFGEWRGYAQYQAFIRTTSDPAGHAVISLVVDIDPRGKVVGSSVANGCKLLGLAAPGVSATIVTLNVTLRDCTYDGYNRTYQGYFSVLPREKYGKLHLQAIDTSLGKAGNYVISATMRR